MDKDIKILRLSGGEDIIGECLIEGDKTIITEPMSIMVQRNTSASAMVMVPWLPVELIDDNISIIDNKDILTTAQPRDSLIEYYYNMVKQTQLETKVSDKYLDKANQQLIDYIDEEVEEYANSDDPELAGSNIETIDDLLSTLGKNKRQLH